MSQKQKKYPPAILNNTATSEAVEEVCATTQAISYIPYGEVFVEQQSGRWSSPYLFNAKELDSETGLYYYGARYLDPSDAMWLSVDPLWEEHAGMSCYAYCMGNPVRLTDPNGMVECDENGNMKINYNPELVKAVMKHRAATTQMDEKIKNYYYDTDLATVGDNGRIQFNSGITFDLGVAYTDEKNPFIVCTPTNKSEETQENRTNCAGISMLGGQAVTYTGYEADVVKNDEYDPCAPNSLVEGGISVVSDQMNPPYSHHFSILTSNTKRIIYSNSYSTTFVTKNLLERAYEVTEINNSSTYSLTNAFNKTNHVESNVPMSVKCYNPKEGRGTPRPVHSLLK